MTSNYKKRHEETRKGLSSLLGNIQQVAVSSGSGDATDYTKFLEIDLNQIEANPKNPRKVFEESPLQELVESVRMHGLIQPITVMLSKEGKYQLISGERRWRAAQLAGLQKIPCYIRQANDNEFLEWAIIENLQRESLNPIETALGFQRMIEELNYTQEEVADRVGKDRTTIANIIRLLKLPPDIQLALKESKISMGHARAIINLSHIDEQLSILKQIQTNHLSVRQTEEIVRKQQAASSALPAKKTGTKTSSSSIHFQKVEQELSDRFQTKVVIENASHSKSGKLIFSYKDVHDFNRLLDLLQKK